MQILEDRIPVRPGKLVDGVDRGLDLGRARQRPADSSVAVRSVIGPRIDWASSRRAIAILLLLERAHPEHEPRDAIGLVDLQNAFGELDRLVDLAVRQHRQEGALEKLVVARVAAQRGAIIRSGGGGIPLTACMPCGQIAAGRRGPGETRGCLRPSREHCRPSGGECGHCGHGRTPETWRKDHGWSTPSGGRAPWRGRVEQNGLFGSGAQ